MPNETMVALAGALALLAPPQGMPMPPGLIPPEAVEITRMFFVTIAAIALGIPLIRALSRRFLAPRAAPPAFPVEVQTRLARIEEAVDAIAIEVERISEAQRFQTKLLAEPRGEGAASAPARGGQGSS